MKIAFISLGCAKALVDTEIMMGIVKEHGYELTPSLDDADLVVVNTCAFLKEARQETEETVRELLNKGKKVIMAGCYVNWAGDSLREKFPEIFSSLDTESLEKIPLAIKGKSSFSSSLYLPTYSTPRLISTPPVWAYMKISEGCSRKCSFCIIPKIRGPYRSRPVKDLVEEARIMEERGIKEINIISQDTISFGRDRGESLRSLLESLLRNTEEVWIRLLYLYPSQGIEKILDIFSHPRLLSYFDIPFQHSHPSILKSMGRAGDGEKYLELIEKIRDSVEDATIRTSLIVGFPGEGDKEFQYLLKWVERAKIDRLGVFKYSREKGAGAYPLGDPVPEEEKERRANLIMELQRQISMENHKKMVGKKLKVLIEGRVQEGVYFGRSSHFAPEVDGGIYIPGEVSKTFAMVKITHAHPYDLEGEVL